MKLITRQDRANQALSLCMTSELVKQSKLDALTALGPTPDPNAVDAIMGYDDYTQIPLCDECGAKAPAIVMLGEEPDPESSTACVCLGCLRRATELIDVTLENDRVKRAFWDDVAAAVKVVATWPPWKIDRVQAARFAKRKKISE